MIVLQRVSIMGVFHAIKPQLIISRRYRQFLRRPLHGSQSESPRLESPRLESPRLVIFCGFPCGLHSALLALAPPALVLADTHPPALLASAPLALVLADFRPAALSALAPPALVPADACPPALLALAPPALVRTDACPPALLASSPRAMVLADSRPPAILACAPPAVCTQTLRFGPESEASYQSLVLTEAHTLIDFLLTEAHTPFDRHVVAFALFLFLNFFSCKFRCISMGTEPGGR
jgi:hypothetical protein